MSCSGDNFYGQVGNGSIGGSSSRAVGRAAQVSNLTNVIQVAVGHYHSCAIRRGGEMWCWGYNSSGQLGNGTTTTSGTPVQVR